MFFFSEIKWLLYSETTAAMEWSRKEMSNVGIIIREKQTSLKMGFLCFAFQNHELCVFSVVLLAVFLRFRILNSMNNFISETRESMFFTHSILSDTLGYVVSGFFFYELS